MKSWTVWHDGAGFVICHRESWRYLTPACQPMVGFRTQLAAELYVARHESKRTARKRLTWFFVDMFGNVILPIAFAIVLLWYLIWWR